MQKPRAILFDWDNTLVDSWPIIHAALTRTFEAMGMEPWSEEDVRGGRDNIHHSLRSSFPRIFGENRWEEARQHYYDHFTATHLEKIRPVADAEQVLEHLAGRGIYMAVVSNKTGQYLRDEVRHLGWDRFFTKIIGAMDVEEDKPSAKPVYAALENSDITPNASVWLVGDSATDIETALNASCTPHFFGESEIPPQFHQDTRLKTPMHHSRNHRELYETVKHW